MFRLLYKSFQRHSKAPLTKAFKAVLIGSAATATTAGLCIACHSLSSFPSFLFYRCDKQIKVHKLGWNELHEAAVNGDYEKAKQLIQEGCNVNARDNFTFRFEGDLDAVYAAIQERESRFPLWATDNCTGATALHYAVFSGNLAIVELLLEAGADPTLTDSLGRTARDYAENVQIDLQFDKSVKKQEKAKAAKEKQQRKLFPLEDRLKKVIVGQEGAIDAVSSAIRRKENGWNNEEKPLVLMFMGSSGIGKTELAKQVAKYLHKDPDKGFIRIDMTEFQSKHEVSKFIGSPPGYVGYEEGGQLTAKLSEQPDAVVLFDEVEKAHPDILNVMLQLFDEGHLTDGKGRRIECKDAVFIMTSNLAQREIADEAEALREAAKQRSVASKEDSLLGRKFMNDSIYPILRSHFKRDEFIGRIDEVVFFLPFNPSELHLIVEKELTAWGERARKRHGMSITWTPQVVELLAEGYNKRYGARSIKHEVDRKVVNQLAKAHEAEQLSPGASVHLHVKEGKVALQVEKTKQTSTSSMFSR